MGEADRQAPGPFFGAARQVVKLLHRLMGDVVVIFKLVGDLRHARAGDGAKVVVPPVDPLPRLAVIRRPAEIGGVDVGRQAFLEPVQLIGADEMHLARKGRRIARPAQVVGIGRDVGAEFGGVVIDAGAAGQLAGHEARPPRRAEGGAGIGIGKPDRARGKRLQVRRVQPVGRAVGEQRSVQLIDHQDQDVRLLGHGFPRIDFLPL